MTHYLVYPKRHSVHRLTVIGNFGPPSFLVSSEIVRTFHEAAAMAD